jgi:parallel beta-helix repeat protein
MTKFIKNPIWIILFSLPVIFMTSCKDDDTPDIDPEPAKEIIIAESSASADDAQLAFIEVEEEYTIIFEEGVFTFGNTLSMDGKTNVVIKGAGKDKTFLDFSGQTSGGEGVLITNSNSIRIENLTIRDSKGDALKTKDCNKISFVNIATIWSGDPSTDNGAYGLYPVLCTEVYIDNCYAYGASDAGIYVGQSDQVILKNCIAEGNVAGIEIENTTNADVFDNEAFDNTGGILVFDLPGLTKSGNATRVFNNNIHDNNRPNFAPAGNIVASVPNGTGCMILSTKNVEFFGNTISENQFAGILISNYLFINDMPSDPDYDPFPAGIYIHDNTHLMTGTVDVVNQPEDIQQIIGLLDAFGLDQPHVLTDGLLMAADAVCIQEMSSTFVNINAGDPTFMSVSADVSAHDCTKDPLPEITFDPF